MRTPRVAEVISKHASVRGSIGDSLLAILDSLQANIVIGELIGYFGNSFLELGDVLRDGAKGLDGEAEEHGDRAY